MSIETTISLPEDLKEELDRRTPAPADRDALVTAALRAYLAWPKPGEDAGDLRAIKTCARELNEEAQDSLSHQTFPGETGARWTRDEIYDRKVLRRRRQP